MIFQGEVHWSCFYITPCVAVQEMGCECCDADAGTVLSLSLFFFSLHIAFGNGGHNEEPKL